MVFLSRPFDLHTNWRSQSPKRKRSDVAWGRKSCNSSRTPVENKWGSVHYSIQFRNSNDVSLQFLEPWRTVESRVLSLFENIHPLYRDFFRCSHFRWVWIDSRSRNFFALTGCVVMDVGGVFTRVPSGVPSICSMTCYKWSGIPLGQEGNAQYQAIVIGIIFMRMIYRRKWIRLLKTNSHAHLMVIELLNAYLCV